MSHDYTTILNKRHGRAKRRKCWAGQRSSLLGVPEHRRRVTRAADCGQGGWPGDGARNHGASQVLHQQSGCFSPKAAGGGAAPLEHWELAALESGCYFPGGPEPCEERPRYPEHGHAASISHNLLKQESSLKVGVQGNRLQAGWRDDCLLKALPS